MNRLMIVIAALLFSTAGAAIKGTTLSGLQVTCFRSVTAALFLFAILPKARVFPNKKILMVCVAYAMTVVCFVLSNKLTTAANTIFLQSASPLYIMLFSPMLLKEKINRIDTFLIIPILLGVILLFFGTSGAQNSLATNPLLGNILATCGGFCWATLIMGLRFLRRDDESNQGIILLLWGNIIAGLLTTPFVFPITSFLLNDLYLILFLGIVQISIGYLFMLKGISKVPAFEASLLLLFEPISSPIISWLVHGELVSKLSLMGALCILVATIVKSYFQQRGKRRAS